jgi:hypothetical protein
MIAYSRIPEDEQQSGPPGPESSSSADTAPADPLAPLKRQLAELQDYVAFYLSTRADAIKLQVRTLLVYAALGIVGGIVGVGALLMAAVLALNGIASGFAELLGGRVWAGQLITGASIILIAAIAVVLGMRYLTNSSSGRTKRKYEQWRIQQRARFGHDVEQRAAARRQRA